jgi:hypothetical protein
MSATIAPPALALCPNCAEPLLPRHDGSAALHCPACGQECRVRAPTVGELLQQFGGAYLSTEGALWRTLKLLLLRPGQLTLAYLAGQRRHYVLPLRLYLTVSVLLLLTVRALGGFDVVGGLQRPEVVAAEKGPLPTLTLNLFGAELGVRQGVFVCKGLPQPLCTLVQGRAAQDARSFLQRLRSANERVVAHFGAVMFVLLPAFALCLKLASGRRELRYTEHLVFALHLHSFWFIVLALMQLPWPPLTWGGLALMAVYTMVAGQRVYGGTWWQRLLRAVALTLMYMALLAVAVPMAWLVALLA